MTAGHHRGAGGRSGLLAAAAPCASAAIVAGGHRRDAAAAVPLPTQAWPPRTCAQPIAGIEPETASTTAPAIRSPARDRRPSAAPSTLLIATSRLGAAPSFTGA